MRNAVLKRASNYNKYKTAFSRKIAAERDFREQGGGAEAEASNARQGIAKNLPRAQPLKSQRSEIFVNKGGGAEAETSNARQGIAKNLPRAQPLKLQHSEIFVNKGCGAEAERSNARRGIARNRTRAQPLKSQRSEIVVKKPGICINCGRKRILVPKRRKRMPEVLQYILIGIAAVVVLAIVLKLFKFGFKTILKFVINAAIGIGAIFLLNLIPGVAIPVVWWTALITGIFGIPGVIVVLIISFFI